MTNRRSSDFSELQELRSSLQLAAKSYESDSLEEQRRSVSTALASVADFLASQGIEEALLAPLLRPAIALAEREYNNLDQMFVERARAGRPAATIDELERTGILAAFANHWVRSHQKDGRSLNLKLAEAARKMNGPWFGKVTRANLRTAREIVSQESSDHPSIVIATLFEEMIDDASKSVGKVAAFELMVRFVNESPASKIKGIWKTPTVSPAKED